MWKEHRYGRIAYEADPPVLKNLRERAGAADFDEPLVWGGTYPTLGVRQAIRYSKGALFMAQLRTTLGDAAFWPALRRYRRDRARRTVNSIGLHRAPEASSGQGLRPLSAEWVFGESLSDR